MYGQQMPKLSPEEVIDYLRKSRSDDPDLTVEEVLEKHENILNEWAIKHLGGIVPECNKFREVVSGETLKERPEISKVLRLIESPRYKAVKVVEPQRLTRGDLEDIGRLMKLFKHTDTLIITPQRVYNLRDEYDFDAFERELKRGNEYLEYVKKILNRGRLESVKAGNFLGSIPPYGYDKIFVQDGKKKCPTLRENKAQADVVRMIFDMYVNQNMGRQKICTKLDGMGIKPPKGEHWSPYAMADMLLNIHYIGKVRWNWRKTVTIVEDSEFIKSRPKSSIDEYMIFDGKHEAIIPEALFYAAVEKSGKNPKVRKNKDLKNPLAGLAFCAVCGRSMAMQPFYDREESTRFLCPNQKNCKNASCRFEEILDRVCQILDQCIEDFEIRLNNDTGDSVKLHANLIKNLENRLEELQRKELAQWEAQSHPDESQRMPPHIFRQLNEKLLKEKEEVQAALCKAKESAPAPVDYEEKTVTFREAVDALRNPGIDAAKKHKLISACIERIEYKRERAERVTFKGNFKGQSPWDSKPIDLDVKLRI